MARKDGRLGNFIIFVENLPKKHVLRKNLYRTARNPAHEDRQRHHPAARKPPLGFDLEELKSFQPDFELHYSIRAAIAHGERENIHDNIAMSINQKILDGTSSIYSRPCYGYRKSEDGSLLIVPEEAETVRLIFNLYLSGYSIIGIIHELESRSISSPTGKPKWCRRAIDTLLSNEKYRGGSTATTVLMSDAPQSKQRARYLFSDHHEAIIDEKTFIAVAKEKQRRCNIEVDENGVHRKKTRYTAKIRVSGSLKEE